MENELGEIWLFVSWRLEIQKRCNNVLLYDNFFFLAKLQFSFLNYEFQLSDTGSGIFKNINQLAIGIKLMWLLMLIIILNREFNLTRPPDL